MGACVCAYVHACVLCMRVSIWPCNMYVCAFVSVFMYIDDGVRPFNFLISAKANIVFYKFVHVYTVLV